MKRPVFLWILLSFILLGTLPPPVWAQDQPGDEQTVGTTNDGQASHAGADSPQAEGGVFDAFMERVKVRIDQGFGTVNRWVEPVLFFDVTQGSLPPPKTKPGEPPQEPRAVPLIVLVLLLGAIFFTLRLKFINIRLFAHGLKVIGGKYDDPHDHGEISHFQALTSALSATVGLGNIAGVAIAIDKAGPGAVFWMWVLALFGMTTKFCSCTLSQAYRKISDRVKQHHHREHVLGGPMLYLEEGMKQVFGRGIGKPLGKVLAISFAIFAILGAIGGGNMFQSNQAAEVVSFVALDGDKSYAWLIGLIMATFVGLVIVGGIRRIGEVTSRLVPAMCVFYCVVCILLIVDNLGQVPMLLGSIFANAFNYQAVGWGGLAGVLAIGIQRGAFSSEAGLGSAAIAHSAARTNEPVREGVVAMLGPFIDTIVVCTMTALAILLTQAQIDPAVLEGAKSIRGAALTAEAFGTLGGFFPLLLVFAVFVFAFSTMISWNYYGESAAEYLFGRKGIWPFRIIYLLAVIAGPLITLNSVLDFTNFWILSMAYPNVLGLIILSPIVAKMANDYVRRLKSGEMKTYQQKLAESEGDPSI